MSAFKTKGSNGGVFQGIPAAHRLVGERGSPRIKRAPSERGPNSMRPWDQLTAR
jgi:hypothetical protein